MGVKGDDQSGAIDLGTAQNPCELGAPGPIDTEMLKVRTPKQEPAAAAVSPNETHGNAEEVGPLCWSLLIR